MINFKKFSVLFLFSGFFLFGQTQKMNYFDYEQYLPRNCFESNICLIANKEKIKEMAEALQLAFKLWIQNEKDFENHATQTTIAKNLQEVEKLKEIAKTSTRSKEDILGAIALATSLAYAYYLRDYTPIYNATLSMIDEDIKN